MSHILSTNLLEVMFLHWSKKLKSIPILEKTADDEDEGEDYNTSGELTPLAPLPPSISRTSRNTATSRLLATWMGLIPTLHVRPLSQSTPLDPATGLFCTVKWNPGCSLALPSLLDGKDWDKPVEDCCWACTRDQLIWPFRQVSLGGMTSLRLWGKENCEVKTSWHCLETELSTCAKIWAEFPTCLDTALSRMSWTSRTIHTLQTQV